MKSVTLEISESIIAKAELLAQIEYQNLNQLVSNLLEDYINSCLESLTQSKNERGTTVKEKKQITLPMIEIAYKIAKTVYEGNLSRTEGKHKVNELSGMGVGSAQDYITNFLSLMNGNTYTRTMSTLGTDYFLRNIFKDYGLEQFKVAVNATKNHLKYYETVSPTKSPKRANLLKQLERELL